MWRLVGLMTLMFLIGCGDPTAPAASGVPDLGSAQTPRVRAAQAGTPTAQHVAPPATVRAPTTAAVAVWPPTPSAQTGEYRIILVPAPPEPTPPPPQTVLPVADVLAVGQGYTIALHAVADPAEAGRYNQPRGGFRQVAFDVTVTNTGSAPLGTNAGAFRVVASDGPGHLMFFRGVEPQLDTTGLGPGASARGWVTFHVEAYAVLTGLTYTLLATTSSVTFALR